MAETWSSNPSVPNTGGTFDFPTATTEVVYTINYTDNNGCTATTTYTVTPITGDCSSYGWTANTATIPQEGTSTWLIADVSGFSAIPTCIERPDWIPNSFLMPPPRNQLVCIAPIGSNPGGTTRTATLKFKTSDGCEFTTEITQKGACDSIELYTTRVRSSGGSPVDIALSSMPTGFSIITATTSASWINNLRPSVDGKRLVADVSSAATSTTQTERTANVEVTIKNESLGIECTKTVQAFQYVPRKISVSALTDNASTFACGSAQTITFKFSETVDIDGTITIQMPHEMKSFNMEQVPAPCHCGTEYPLPSLSLGYITGTMSEVKYTASNGFYKVRLNTGGGGSISTDGFNYIDNRTYPPVEYIFKLTYESPVPPCGV